MFPKQPANTEPATTLPNKTTVTSCPKLTSVSSSAPHPSFSKILLARVKRALPCEAQSVTSAVMSKNPINPGQLL